MISFVYFDVGGVLEIDFSGNNKWRELGEQLGVVDDKQSEFEKLWQENERSYCTNEEVSMMISLLNNRLGLSIPSDYDLLHAFTNLYDKNPSIWPVVAEIHKKLPVGLFTMMYPHLLDIIIEEKLIPQENWDAILDSSVEMLTKYDDEFYRLAEERAHTPASGILLVENSQKHIDHAKDMGWQTFFYNTQNPEASSKELLHFFRNIINE